MESWTLDVRGLALRVWELNGGTGEPVICLHGWLDHGLAFARVAEGRTGRWVALDQRGFGGSAHVGPGAAYHFPDYLADLDALVRRLGGRVSLVGHSMGGTVAALYAGARPDRVRRLVCVEGLGALEAEPERWVGRARQFLDGLARPPRRMRLRSPEDAARRLVRRHEGLSEDHARLLAEHGTAPSGDGFAWSFDPLHLVRNAMAFPEEALHAFLGEITAPTLLVWGRESWYPAEIRSHRAAWIPAVREEVLEGGHMLPYEAPDALGRLVEAHLAAP